jgi:hypothetical protein
MDALFVIFSTAVIAVSSFFLSMIRPVLLAAIILGAITAAIIIPILRYVQRSYRK